MLNSTACVTLRKKHVLLSIANKGAPVAHVHVTVCNIYNLDCHFIDQSVNQKSSIFDYEGRVIAEGQKKPTIKVCRMFMTFF